MSDYTLGELEAIIEAGEEKIEELVQRIADAGGEYFDEMFQAGPDDVDADEAFERYERLNGVLEGLRERVHYLREELDRYNAEMAEQYEADCEEAMDDYLAEGGEVDENGAPIDKDLFAAVFNEMQFSRVENGL